MAGETGSGDWAGSKDNAAEQRGGGEKAARETWGRSLELELIVVRSY